MPKLIFSFVFVLYLTAAHSQKASIDNFIEDCKKAIPSCEQLKAIIVKYKKDTAAFKVYGHPQRVNYFEFIRNDLLIQKADPEHKLLFRYQLEFLSNDSLVLFCRLHKSYDNRQPSSDKETLIEYRDTNKIKEHITAFNQKYLTSYADLQYIFSTEHDVFGIAWGYAFPGMLSVFEPMEGVYKMVKAKDKQGILKLCYSRCNETRCYGAAGLYLLQKEDSNLDREIMKLLKTIQQSGDIIDFAWGGCEIERQKISETLTDKYLEEVYSSYLFYKANGVKELR